MHLLPVPRAPITPQARLTEPRGSALGCPILRLSRTKNEPHSEQSRVPAAGPTKCGARSRRSGSGRGRPWQRAGRASCIDSNAHLRHVLPRCPACAGAAVPGGRDGDGAGALSAPAQGRGRPRERARRSSDGRHIKERGARLTGSGGRGRTRRSRGQRRRTRREPDEAGPAEPAGDRSQPGETAGVRRPAPAPEPGGPGGGADLPGPQHRAGGPRARAPPGAAGPPERRPESRAGPGVTSASPSRFNPHLRPREAAPPEAPAARDLRRRSASPGLP